MLDRDIDIAILAQPLRSATMKHRHPLRLLGFECIARNCTEKMVKAEPVVLSVKWDEEKVGILQIAENSSGLPLAGHIFTQRR